MPHPVRPRWTAAAISLIASLVACANPFWLPPALPPPPPPVEPEPYVIGVTDMLDIYVWKNPELTTGAMVRTDGKISVPLLDDVQAEGLTPVELKEVITQSLAEFVSAPDVTVIVAQMNHRTVSIVGAVGRSGQIGLQRHTRVLDAIAQVGGFSVWAKTRRVRILRPTPDGILEYRFNYRAFLAGKAPESNLLLVPGDTIVVPD